MKQAPPARRRAAINSSRAWASTRRCRRRHVEGLTFLDVNDGLPPGGGRGGTTLGDLNNEEGGVHVSHTHFLGGGAAG